MENRQRNVKAFMEAAEQKVRSKPEIPSEAERILRAKLTLEEAFELAKASGIEVTLAGNVISDDRFGYCVTGEVDMEGVADAIADQNYISYGTAITYGIDMELIEDLVHECNMAKFDGGYRREDGKWVKPENWVGPESFITEELKRQYGGN